jgi:succinate dehydrogenase/fumarate reductase flavoprotein subunit
LGYTHNPTTILCRAFIHSHESEYVVFLRELEKIIRCAEFSANAAMARKESRWGSSHQHLAQVFNPSDHHTHLQASQP